MPDLSPTALVLLALAMGYLCGSVPFGLLLTRMFGLGDVRKLGSGNIGATNVLRTGNKFVAAATLAADMLKGTIPVLIAASFSETAAIAAGFGAFLGHNFPVWLRFKGGKGVATYIGVQIGLLWPVAIVFLIVWLLVAILFRYSSLSALVASIAAPVAAFVLGSTNVALAFAVMSAIILFTHRENISRLLNQEESRINLRS